jgi:hypothetical protein
MEASGKPHDPAALPPGKEPPVSIRQEAGWAPDPVWTLWLREKSCTAGNRPRAVLPVARPYTDWAIPTASNMLITLKDTLIPHHLCKQYSLLCTQHPAPVPRLESSIQSTTSHPITWSISLLPSKSSTGSFRHVYSTRFLVWRFWLSLRVENRIKLSL